MTQNIGIESSDAFCFGSVTGASVSSMRGRIDLVIAWPEGGSATRVTGCDARFTPAGPTRLVGAKGEQLHIPAGALRGVLDHIPFGRVLCYGPQEMLGPLSEYIDITLRGTFGSNVMGDGRSEALRCERSVSSRLLL